MCFNNELYINFRKFSDAEHHLGYISLDKKILSYNYENELNLSLEELDIIDITTSTNQLRAALNNLDELAESISKIGLLQPIVVRSNSSNKHEVVAGNRRLNACKMLGWRKITCHLVKLDDKQAFEASIVE